MITHESRSSPLRASIEGGPISESTAVRNGDALVPAADRGPRWSSVWRAAKPRA
jgi:hypothetical protein